jgi:hypothetical protein
VFRKLSWNKIIRSWWGRSIAGALLGGLLVAMFNIDSPGVFIFGMIGGGVALFLLGRLE